MDVIVFNLKNSRNLKTIRLLCSQITLGDAQTNSTEANFFDAKLKIHFSDVPH